MASRISNQELIRKVTQFLTTDSHDAALEALIKEAIIKADRELRNVDQFSPLAWDKVTFDGIRTSIYAEITDVSAANPGIVTAESVDSSISAHGFRDNSGTGHQDIVIIDSLDEPEELNGRAFLLVYIDADTFSLRTLDNTSAIDTSSMTAYSSGGVAYHAGIKLNATTVLSGITAWTIKRLIDNPTFDGYGTDPISEQQVRQEKYWTDVSSAQRPKMYRYWENITEPDTPTVGYYLLWYPPCNNEYNLLFPYEKEITDISTWNSSTYPYHPPEVHDAIWHGALANLVGDVKRMQRQSTKGHVTRMEILFAEKWLVEWEKDKKRVLNYSRKLMGATGGMKGFSA